MQKDKRRCGRHHHHPLISYRVALTSVCVCASHLRAITGEGFRQGHHKEYMICASSQLEVRTHKDSRRLEHNISTSFWSSLTLFLVVPHNRWMSGLPRLRAMFTRRPWTGC
jgi:hypothetical protein